MRKLFYAIIIICLCLIAPESFAQGTQTKFGKNRVQYHQDFDEWMQYESDNFITYWYGEGRNIGQFTVQMAEEDFDYISTILEHRINERLQIIVYTDLTDLKQSNIGSEEAFTNTGGQTKIVGNKIFVHFNGSHYDLRREIREGIASVYLESMLFGSNIQEIVQNAVMMNLPDWFKEGLVSYIGEPWNTELDNKLRDYVLSEDFKDFERLAEDDPQLAGHALWYFIGQNFGQPTVSNLLYLTRINRSVESGFLYVLGSPYEMVLNSWSNYFRERYKGDDLRHGKVSEGYTKLEVKNKRKLPISQLKVSPNGQQVVYVTNEIGKYKVYLQDIGTGDRQVIHKGGFRNAFQETDYSYPLVAWSPSGTEIAVVYERRDVIKLLTYDVFTKKKKNLDLAPEYQRVYSMEYVNPISLVFSGGVRGHSDIFIYYTNTRQTQRITQDHWDDVDANYVNIDGRQAILFASNRPDSLLTTERLDSILPVDRFDLFYYDLEDRSKELIRLTHTPFADERQPVAIDSFHFSYLSDQNGIYNREKGYLEEYIHHYDTILTLKDGSEVKLENGLTMESLNLDSIGLDTIVYIPVIKKRAVTYPVTDYNRNIVEQNTSMRADRVVELVYNNNQHEIYYGGMPSDSLAYLIPSVYRTNQLSRSGITSVIPDRRPARPETPVPENTVPVQEEEKVEVPVITQPKRTTTPDTAKIVIDSYLFQSEFDDEPEEEQPETPPVTQPSSEKIPESQQPAADDPALQTIRVRPAQPNGRPVTTEVPTTSGQPSQEAFRFRPGRITPYRLQFRTDYVTTQMDNSLLFEGLDSYASNTDGYNYPPPGILLKANFKDLFEDHEFEGGVRIPTTFNGTEYFLTYSNKKKRLDKTFAVYRRNQRFTEESNTFVPNKRETNILLGQFGVRYPLDIFRSLRATATIRRDRTMLLATDVQSLNAPVIREQRAGIKLEYVFDNTLDVSLNIKNGSRYKVYAEVVKKFSLDVTEGFQLDLAEGFMTVLGFDARHYQRLDRRSIFAIRAAGATSFGSERNLYFLGAVDNWLFPMFNNDIPQPASATGIAYQTLASNLRGFDYNIRNGTTFLLANAELRVPIFQYLSKRIRSSFFRNFQVVGFFDVGSAWTGPSPYSDDNPLNTTVFAGGDNIQVKVTYFRDPIVAGYGAGIRSMLFGYFIRLDYAWGIETRQVQDPKLYISLGMDF